MIRPIAIHLPQFHPIPENDQWWGKGFTEWTNVSKAQPLFKGHYQPHLPSHLGFYDLRLEEARVAQAEMARQFGIYGFCYYHYWFHGRRLLNRPIDDILKSGKPDFPFMLCWANGSWTRTWDGDENILMEQTYSPEDDLAHIRFLAGAFKDPRYIKIDNKPVFAVCRTEMMPDPAATAALWRDEMKKAGFEDIYLIRMEMFEAGYSATNIGFDASAEFQPDWRNFPRPIRPLSSRILNRLDLGKDAFSIHRIYQYRDIVEKMLKKRAVDYKLFPGIMPGWDNSARKASDGVIVRGSTPELFKYWLKEITRRYTPYSKEENFIFFNAWNEWAEGNHLEPDRKWGTAYLEAIKDVIDNITP